MDFDIVWQKCYRLSIGNKKTLYYATSNNLCFCTTWQNAETRKSHISLNWIVLHTQCTCALSFWKNKKLSSVMCLIASNICWDSKISIDFYTRLDEEQLPSFTQRLSSWQTWLTQSMWVTHIRMLCSLPIGPVWCTCWINLTVKGGSALTRWYF